MAKKRQPKAPSVRFPINTKVRGISFGARQKVASWCKAGEVLKLVREPDNEHDENAIAVHLPRWFYGGQLGYVSAELAEQLAPLIDGGFRMRAVVLERTGGGWFNRVDYGVNFQIEADS